MQTIQPTRLFVLLIILFATITTSFAQQLYSAKGYWDETKKDPYKTILESKLKGESLSSDQEKYLLDYQEHLAKYYLNMSEEEKVKYAQLKSEWDKKPVTYVPTTEEDFNLRPKDRLINGLYGAYYGASLVAIAETDNAGVSVGVPLIMAGLWQLGPVINPKKYENISVATIRAANGGKILGLGYGLAAGLAIGGDSDNTYKWSLGLSTVGSIALGEIAFQTQKKRQLSVGHVDLMRHYGFLGPVVTGLGYLAIDENPNLIGASLLAGGVAGLIIGNKTAKRYDYSQGDVDVISSLTWISAGLGATVAVGTIEDDINRGLILIPAATAVAGTFFGQRSVKGVHVTSRQGSTISLASGGAALIGLGAVALTETEGAGWWVGVPSACALIMHQSLFHSYRKKNLEDGLRMGRVNKHPTQFSMRVMPENFFVNRQLSAETIARNPSLSYPLVQMKLVF